MRQKLNRYVAFLLLMWFPVCSVLAFDSDWSDLDDLPPIPSEIPAETPAETPSTNEPAYESPSTYGDEPLYETETENIPEPVYQPPVDYGSYSADVSSSSTTDEVGSRFVSIIKGKRHEESMFQNAIIEGVQISTEKGKTDDELIVNGYFIFRDKPTSYFYEVKHKEKKLVFEFNDTRTGSSPVANVIENPIKGFTIEEMQVDGNKEIKGLNPEWRDLIRVTFDLEQIPEFVVSDEHSIISFKYKWTTDPEKIPQYVVKDRFPAVFLWSGVGLGSLGVGLLSYFIFNEPPKPPFDPVLPDNDLPNRKIGK